VKNLRVVTQDSRTRISLVLPIYNEIDVLPLLIPRIRGLLDEIKGGSEAIFVDDGSSDGSEAWLCEALQSEPRFKLIKLSRNFGHQIAITAGMDAASGEAVVVMDADLQDPPELVHKLIAKWEEGFEVVYARRIRREGESWFKRATAHAFYRVLGKLTTVDVPADVGDFRLVGPKALATFRSMPERHRFVRGMFSWMGFRQTAVDFERPSRELGESKYPIKRMLRLASDAITSFSDKPLRLALWSGLVISIMACIVGTLAILAWSLDYGVVPGWTSILVVVSFFSGFNLMMTGIVGLYVGGIYAEVKRRPLYVVDRLTGFDDALRRMVVEAPMAAAEQHGRMVG
jgi:glycosyltransferase involved in cell wall biosynthesis